MWERAFSWLIPIPSYSRPLIISSISSHSLTLSSTRGYYLPFGLSFGILFVDDVCSNTVFLEYPLLLRTAPKILLQVLSILPQRALRSACLYRPVHKLLVLEQGCFSTPIDSSLFSPFSCSLYKCAATLLYAISPFFRPRTAYLRSRIT